MKSDQQAPIPAEQFNPVLKLGFLILTVGLLMSIFSGPLYRFELLGLRTAFTVLRYSYWVGLAAAVLCLVGGFIHGKRHGWTRTARPIVAVWLALVVAWVPYSLRQQAASVPPIHDISTDLENPPAFEALVELRDEGENPTAYAGQEVARQQREAYPDIGPVYLNATPEEAFVRCQTAARAMGWEIVAAVAADGRIEAVATTAWFGFRDDVVIRIQENGEQGRSRVDVRSQSRVGVSDLGANAERIREFLERLESE